MDQLEKGEYVLYLSKPDVLNLYIAGYIVPHHLFSTMLGTTVPDSPQPVPAINRYVLRWAFEMRAAVISQQRFPDPFLLLFICESTVNLAEAALLHPDKFVRGLSGSGDHPFGKLTSPFSQPWLDKIRTLTNYLKMFPPTGMNPGTGQYVGPKQMAITPLAPLDTGRSVSTVVPKVPAGSSSVYLWRPRMVHLTLPRLTLNELRSSKPTLSDQEFMDSLDRLTSDEVDPHGELSVAVAERQLTPNTYSVTFVCREYPALNEPLSTAQDRWNIAFTSPGILSLKAGDVVFVSRSSDFTDVSGSRQKLPLLFDLSVCYLTMLLEAKGVTVIFSGGGNARKTNDISDQVASLPRILPNTIPGLIIGAVNESLTDFQSYYANFFTCYGKAQPVLAGKVFDESSGATAYIAGLVVRMQLYYNRSHKGKFLSPATIRNILRADSRVIIRNQPVAVPQWESIRRALDQLS